MNVSTFHGRRDGNIAATMCGTACQPPRPPPGQLVAIGADGRHTDFLETLATFRLFGHGGCTARAVTDRLALRPSFSGEAGDLVSPRSSSRREGSVWGLRSAPAIEDEMELSEHLERLLRLLEPVRSALWDLQREGYEANWFCFVSSDALEHAVELDRPLCFDCCNCPAISGSTPVATKRSDPQLDG